MSSVKIVARTIEDTNTNGRIIRNDGILMAGKAAGICYMPDDYLSNGIQDIEKSMKRASRNAASGHYSVYEHMHISFIIKAPKIIAMILNSTGLYSMSEKSGRYTMMNPDDELEASLYHKWIDIYKSLYKEKYEDNLTDSEYEKLAMESARYLLSVFTNTVFEFTVPHNRAILLCGWLDNLAYNMKMQYTEFTNINKINKAKFKKNYDLLYKRLSKECTDLASNIRKAIGITREDYILEDHKSMGIELFSDLSYMYKLNSTSIFNDYIANNRSVRDLLTKKESYGDIYTSNYFASFVELAQAQRHRTLRYSIIDCMLDKTEYICYEPSILAGTEYEIEWFNDYSKLISKNILPQGTKVHICEQGRFEEFVYKCKERCCYRAQEEIRDITTLLQLEEFDTCRENLSYCNKKILDTLITEANRKTDYMTRCRFLGYVCKEPCKFIKLN